MDWQRFGKLESEKVRSSVVLVRNYHRRFLANESTLITSFGTSACSIGQGVRGTPMGTRGRADYFMTQVKRGDCILFLGAGVHSP